MYGLVGYYINGLFVYLCVVGDDCLFGLGSDVEEVVVVEDL